MAKRLPDKGVVSQSRGVVSWRRVGMGNFFLGQARAR